MEIIDTHCHLTFDPLAGDLDGVLRRAETAGVAKIVVPAVDRDSWPVVRALSGRGGVYAAFGLHPCAAREALDLHVLGTFLEGEGVVAVGEIGLDFKIDGGNRDRERQVHVFRAQVALARDLRLPVILHCRGAFEEMLAMLRPFAPKLRGVVHAYSRGPELARRFLDLGLFLAFGGAVTRPRARRAHRSALTVPSDRLLVETDAPAIGLEGVAAEDAEPRHALDVVHALARVRGDSPSDIAAQTTANATELFGFDD